VDVGELPLPGVPPATADPTVPPGTVRFPRRGGPGSAPATKGWTRTAAPTVRVVSAGGLALGVALPSLSDGAGPGTAPTFDGLADNDDIRLQRLNIYPHSSGGSARTASSMVEPVTLRS